MEATMQETRSYISRGFRISNSKEKFLGPLGSLKGNRVAEALGMKHTWVDSRDEAVRFPTSEAAQQATAGTNKALTDLLGPMADDVSFSVLPSSDEPNVGVESVPQQSENGEGFIVKLSNPEAHIPVLYLTPVPPQFKERAAKLGIINGVEQDIEEATIFVTREEAQKGVDSVRKQLEKIGEVVPGEDPKIEILPAPAFLKSNKPTDTIPAPTIIKGEGPYIAGLPASSVYIGDLNGQDDPFSEGSRPVYVRAQAKQFATVEEATAAVNQLLAANPARSVPPSMFVIEPLKASTQDQQNGFVVEDRSPVSNKFGVTHVTKTHVAHDDCHGYGGTDGRENAFVFSTKEAAQAAIDNVMAVSPEIESEKPQLHIVPASAEPFYIKQGNAALN